MSATEKLRALLDKLLRWNELRVQLKAAERVGMELAS
jgi:hypothetical protein